MVMMMITMMMMVEGSLEEGKGAMGREWKKLGADDKKRKRSGEEEKLGEISEKRAEQEREMKE